MKLPLDKARICLECDTIHDQASCPECGSASYHYLANWVKLKRPPSPAPPQETAERREPPPRKKRRLLRKAVLAGAGLLAAYGFLFKPSRKKPPEE